MARPRRPSCQRPARRVSPRSPGGERRWSSWSRTVGALAGLLAVALAELLAFLGGHVPPALAELLALFGGHLPPALPVARDPLPLLGRHPLPALQIALGNGPLLGREILQARARRLTPGGLQPRQTQKEDQGEDAEVARQATRHLALLPRRQAIEVTDELEVLQEIQLLEGDFLDGRHIGTCRLAQAPLPREDQHHARQRSGERDGDRAQPPSPAPAAGLDLRLQLGAPPAQ